MYYYSFITSNVLILLLFGWSIMHIILFLLKLKVLFYILIKLHIEECAISSLLL